MAEKPAVTTPSQPWSVLEWSIAGALVALVAIVFAQVATHEFLNYDDPQFVFFNQAVRDGDIHWALTSTSLTWLPLTWISYMIDFRIFGLQAGGYLIVNAIFHALSACLLFAALWRMTAEVWPSAFVAALFAIHPAHVESVAWIAERKDVLSTLFAIVALLFYARRKLPLAAVAMVLSLMAKQTYVTLPLIFLLLDYWPLGRMRRGKLAPLLIEKLPFFALSILGSIAAFAGQQGIQSLSSTALVPIARRVANAFVAYARYLVKMVLPVRLAVLYPLNPVGVAPALLAAALFIAITVVVIVVRKRAPYLLVGWLWFVGALVPLIGLVQIGGQAMADRYTYFAYIGLSIALAWGAMALPIARRTLAGIAVAVVAIFAATAWRQTSYWKNCDTLFTHTIAVTGNNAIAEYSLGQYLQVSDPPRALTHLQRAIDLGTGWADKGNNPLYGWFTQSHVAASTALLMEARNIPPGPARTAKLNESIAHARRAIEIEPQVAQAPGNIALAERVLAADAQAPQQAQTPQPQPTAPQLSPSPQPSTAELARIGAFLDKGTSLSQAGKYEEAVAEFRKAVEIAPRAAGVHVYLALGLLQAKHRDEAVAQLRTAKMLDPIAANDILTRALHMQPDPRNIDMLLMQLQSQN
jgi:tetratricopeptide (TPR) repeat protein